LQKWIGNAGVKSLPVIFYAQKNSKFSTQGVPIPFELERLNIGGAMNGKTGKFTAPRNGALATRACNSRNSISLPLTQLR
jgi:hypothetical protein